MASLDDEQITQIDTALEMFKALFTGNLSTSNRNSLENELKQLLKISELVVKQYSSSDDLAIALSHFNRKEIGGANFVSYKYKSPFPQQPAFQQQQPHGQQQEQSGNLPPWRK